MSSRSLILVLISFPYPGICLSSYQYTSRQILISLEEHNCEAHVYKGVKYEPKTYRLEVGDLKILR